MTQTVGIAIIGMGWMGEVHARAYRQIADRYYDLPIQPRLVICSDNQEGKAQLAQNRFGFQRYTTDWQAAVNDPEVDIVNITTPNGLHLRMIEAAAAAGKHIVCEKPVGKDWQETVRAEAAARRAGVKTFVGFNYRWAPVVQYLKGLIEEGKLGRLTHYRGRFINNYASNPYGFLTWRFLEENGMGVVGDLGTHVIDMAHLIVGPIKRLVSNRQTFITQRPLPDPSVQYHFGVGTAADPMGEVTNEDYFTVLAQFENGCQGVLEACRVINGPKCDMSFEIHGTLGAAKWEFERMNELKLQWRNDQNPAEDGYTRIYAGPAHGEHGRFNPGPGVGIGYEDLKAIEMLAFLKSVYDGQQREPSFAAALQVANVVAAVEKSWQSERWEDVVDQSFYKMESFDE